MHALCDPHTERDREQDAERLHSVLRKRRHQPHRREHEDWHCSPRRATWQ